MDEPKAKRSRTSNFSNTEKALLLRLALRHKDVLECKKTDQSSNKAKLQTWAGISEEYNAKTTGAKRDPKHLRSKYEATKRELRKGKGKGWRETGGGPPDRSPPPLIEEEKQLRETIILSCEGLAPSRFDSDFDFASGVNPNVLRGRGERQSVMSSEDEEFVEEQGLLIEEEVVEPGDWSTYNPALLQTPVNPLLRSRPRTQPSVSGSPTAPSTNQAHLHPPTSRTGPVSEAGPSTSRAGPVSEAGPSTSRAGPHLSQQDASRRRPVLPKASRSSASLKFEALAERKMEVVEIKKRTALLEEEIAKRKLEVLKEKERYWKRKNREEDEV